MEVDPSGCGEKTSGCKLSNHYGIARMSMYDNDAFID